MYDYKTNFCIFVRRSLFWWGKSVDVRKGYSLVVLLVPGIKGSLFLIGLAQRPDKPPNHKKATVVTVNYRQNWNSGWTILRKWNRRGVTVVIEDWHEECRNWGSIDATSRRPIRKFGINVYIDAAAVSIP